MSKARDISDENNPHVEQMRDEILNAAGQGHLSARCMFWNPDEYKLNYERWVRAATIVQHELDVGWSLDRDTDDTTCNDYAEIRFNWADSQTVNRMVDDDGGDDGPPQCPNCNSSQYVEGPDSDGDYWCTENDGCDPSNYFQ